MRKKVIIMDESNGNKERTFVLPQCFFIAHKFLASLFDIFQLLSKALDFSCVGDNLFQELLLSVEFVSSEFLLFPILKVIFLTIFILLLTDYPVMERFILGLYLFGPCCKFILVLFALLEALVFEPFQSFFSHLLLFDCLELRELFSLYRHLVLILHILQFVKS